MKIRLVFSDWWNTLANRKVHPEAAIKLSKGDFHSGSTFEAEIILDEEQEKELRGWLRADFNPRFFVFLEK